MVSVNNAPLEADYHIKSEYNGNKTLYLAISPNIPIFNLIKEESEVKYNGASFIIKAIDEQDETVNIECQLNLDELKKSVYINYNKAWTSLSQIMTEVLSGTGWTVVNAELVGTYRPIKLTDVNTLGILEECQKVYGIVYKYDNINKVITVIKPNNVTPKDIYITDQLNLRRIDRKSDTFEFCTRLYPYGKVNEETGQAIDIKSANNGAAYVSNGSYANKIISRIWRDERYTDAQSLKDDAIEKLKILSKPIESYQLDVVDISKLNSRYSAFSFNIYDIIKFIDRKRNKTTSYQIVELDEYPLQPELNKIILSTAPPKIEGIITSIVGDLKNIEVDNQIERTKVNEIKRDLDTTVSRVAETYTKGETTALVESKVTQTKNDITMSFINGKISSSTQFSNEGMDIYNGGITVYKDPQGTTNNKEIFKFDNTTGMFSVSGVLKNVNCPDYSLSIGQSNWAANGAFNITYSQYGYGDLVSFYPSTVGSANEIVMNFPFLKAWALNNLGIKAWGITGVNAEPATVMLFADCNDTSYGFSVQTGNGGVCNIIGQTINMTGKTILNDKLVLNNLPTSSAGLAAGTVWNDNGTLKVKQR